MIKNPKLYFVLWHDAHSGAGWYRPNEVEDFLNEERCLVEQVGWLISEDKYEIVLAGRKCKWAKEGDPEWGMLQKIPKAWIRRKKLYTKEMGR